MSGMRAISASRRELSSSFYFLQGKAPKEIHAILTETLAHFFPGRVKDLSAPLYFLIFISLKLGCFVFLSSCTNEFCPNLFDIR